MIPTYKRPLGRFRTWLKRYIIDVVCAERVPWWVVTMIFKIFRLKHI